MRHRNVLLAATAIALAGAAALSAQTAGMKAHADIKGDGITGTLTLTERAQGTGTVVEFTLDVKGLKPGKHGVHLHAVGKCDPDFTAAGGHFDPGPAGNMDPDANHPFHMGDIPNLEVGADGTGRMTGVTTRVTLSPGPLSLFDDGRQRRDHPWERRPGHYGSRKSGVSGGPRVACGVITK